MGKQTICKIVDKVYCISLKNRIDRRKKIKKHLKNRKIKFEFFNAIRNKKDPARGCLQSHLEIIKKAKKDKLKAVMILEDDCFFTKKPTLEIPPNNWDMLYLGGNLEEVIEKKDGDHWFRMRCWTTHSYIIKNTLYDIVIKGLKKYEREVDRFYCEEIHKNHNCYICDPIITKQIAGFSDIEKKRVDYTFVKTAEDLVPFAEPEIEQEDNIVKLKLRDFSDIELPKVSIVTPTRNRKIFFELALHNFLSQDYPANKLEWILIDDGEESISELIPNDDRIKYIKVKGEGKRALTISRKRNMGYDYANGDIIIHMDDDDYYLPSSVSTRVKVLLYYKEKGIDCVGCERFGCHDLQKDMSFIIDKNNEIAEASMGYWKSFIEERKFEEKLYKGEGKLFCRGRNHRIMKLPFEFVFISFTHGKNTHIRKSDQDSHKQFGFDYGVFKILKNIKKQLF